MGAHLFRRRYVHPLPLLCAAFLLLVLAHSAATPVFEAPDEVWHYAYVRWVARGHGLPPLTDNRSGANQQAAQPPLYYGLAALLSGGFADEDLATVLRHNPGFGHQAPTTSVDNKNMLIHPAAQATNWHGAVLALRATRTTSWLFGLLAVCAAWGLGMETFENRRWALVTAALVAFQPQFVFISGMVSNDSGAAAIAGLALWLGVALLRRGPSWRRALMAGGVAGLAALTKLSVLPALPFLAVCLVSSALLHARKAAAEGGDLPKPGAYWARQAGYLAAFILLALGISGWWYVRNLREVGDLLGLQHHTTTLWGRAEPASLIDLLPELPLLFRSFWGAYGWGHVTWPAAVYVLLALLTLPLLGLAVALVVRAWLVALRGPDKHKPGYLNRVTRSSAPGGGILVAGLLSTVWLAGIVASLARWMLLVEAPHGRLLFPALAAWALLLTLGLREVHGRLAARGITQQGARAPARALLGVSAVLAALAPGARILPTFAPPRLRAPDRVLATCSHPQDFAYNLPDGSPGSVAHLLCADIVRDRVEPGDLVTVRACWGAEATMDEDYTVFIHLLGPGNLRVAERQTYPGLGRYPTSLWTPGWAFCDRYTLTVADWAEAPTRYWLEIGLFDAGSGARLRADPDPAIAGAVVVSAPSRASDRATPGLATFGSTPDGSIALAGYEIPSQAASPGDELRVTLHWSASGTPTRDYIAFIHLWEPGDPAPLAQHDAQPRSGWYPTSYWRPGDLVHDTHTLSLPPDLPPGTYPLWAGLYEPGDNTRLPAFGPARLPHDLVSLGTLEVRE